MNNQEKANKINEIIKPYTDALRETFLHEQSAAFVNDDDGKLNVDLCFYNYDDQFSIKSEVLEKISEAGIELENVGDGSGDGCRIECYMEVGA